LDAYGRLIPFTGRVSVVPLDLLNAADIALLKVSEAGLRTTVKLPTLRADLGNAHDVVLLGFRATDSELSYETGTGLARASGEFETSVPSLPGQSGGPWLDARTGLVMAMASGQRLDKDKPSFVATSIELAIERINRAIDDGYRAADPGVPVAQQYCSDIKRVLAAIPGRFSSILGGSYGIGRDPTIPLPGWQDCIIYMEDQFSNSRRYACLYRSFGDAGGAASTGELVAKELVKECLGAGYSISQGQTIARGTATPSVPYWRTPDIKTKGVITIGPSKDILSSSWDLQIEIK
jgi:Trypsin-like peptidase domain